MTAPHITNAMLDALIKDARAAPRRRKHLNLHHSPSEPCQRLLNAIEPESYIHPHRHPTYRTNECLIALRGELALLTFDDAGEVLASHRFGGARATLAVVELEPHSWHTVLALTSGAVLFETKSGPFDACAAKELAPWAPEEDSFKAARYFFALHAIVDGL